LGIATIRPSAEIVQNGFISLLINLEDGTLEKVVP
jgi:hypothetical protein